MRTFRLLIVDDESQIRTTLFRYFDKKGFQIITSQCLEEARKLIQTENPLDLAFVDLNLSDGNGINFMSEIKKNHPHCHVIIISGWGNIQLAIEATQKGAFYFLTKPFELEQAWQLVEKAISGKHSVEGHGSFHHSLGPQQNSSPQKASSQNMISNGSSGTMSSISSPPIIKTNDKKFHAHHIIGKSEGVKSLLSLVERVSDSDSTVLITGESGTGKELVAKAIHSYSQRTQQPFIAINCGAIPSELLESELFGHVKGAFTGAISNRLGRFELADEGTIFLDEIGDLQPAMQVKLLRVLQERSFEPVGGSKSIQVNVRVIAATNRNLEEIVGLGKFREDLFYRLNVIPINVPALRERKEDVLLLLYHFIEYFNKGRTQKLQGVSAEALECLTHYPWPGNIRELENLVERLSIIKGEGTIDVQDLPAKYRSATPLTLQNPMSFDIPEQGMDFNSAVDQFENVLILRALEKTGWNRNQAAMLLRLNRTTLVEKIKKKGLKAPEDAKIDFKLDRILNSLNG